MRTLYYASAFSTFCCLLGFGQPSYAQTIDMASYRCEQFTDAMRAPASTGKTQHMSLVMMWLAGYAAAQNGRLELNADTLSDDIYTLYLACDKSPTIPLLNMAKVVFK